MGESIGVDVKEMGKIYAIKNLISAMKMHGLRNTKELGKLTEICEEGKDLEGFEIRNNDIKKFTWFDNSSWARVITFHDDTKKMSYSIVMGGNDYGTTVCLCKSLNNSANNAEVLCYQQNFLLGDVSTAYSDHGKVMSSNDENGKKYISLNTMGPNANDNKTIDVFVKEVSENFQRLREK